MTEQLHLKANIGKITLDMTTSTTSVNLTQLALAPITDQAVMFVLVPELWPLRGQVILLTLTRAQKAQQQVHTNKATQCSYVIK